MPEEYSGEKTEQPTPRRRIEARQKGQVARSTDLNTAIVLLSVFFVLNLTAGNILYCMETINREIYKSLGNVELSQESVSFYSMMGLGFIARMLLPILGTVFVFAFLVNVVQVGLVFSSEPLKPDINKMNPVKGFKRIMSIRSLVRLGMSLSKLAIIGTVLGLTAYNELDKLFLLFDLKLSLHQTVAYAGYVVYLLGVRAALVLLVLSVLDYAYQRWEMEKELRMTRQELRDELKRMEGDPKIRERRRAVQRQLALQRMMAAVPKAQVVVTNPTELAVALAYDQEKMEAPKVVAKGAGYVAEKIRTEAVLHGVPIVEKKPLARALFNNCEVGDDIPPDLYQAVAELLAYVYEISERMMQGAKAG